MHAAANLALRLTQLAAASSGVSAYRGEALLQVAAATECEVGVYHELSPRSPLQRAGLLGVGRRWLASTLGQWDAMAVGFGAMLADGMAHGGVALASRAFADRSRERQAWAQRIARPLRAGDVAIVHLTVRTRVIAAVVLGRRRRHGPFCARSERLLRALQPALSACDALVQSFDPVRAVRAGLSTSLVCVDGRLTPRQRQVLEHVALGHTNGEAGAALGISAHTVRNLLAQACARLGAANRAEAVHRAVFQ